MIKFKNNNLDGYIWKKLLILKNYHKYFNHNICNTSSLKYYH